MSGWGGGGGGGETFTKFVTFDRNSILITQTRGSLSGSPLATGHLNWCPSHLV